MAQQVIDRKVLLGDEAVALAAVDAGASCAYGYPGTPSTEILEALAGYAKVTPEFQAHWCTNEKTAYEQALGVSLAGRRSIVTMKHVGLNVAADPFMSSALISIHGGLVLAVADDPGMHSSQNEQDSRYFADFARIICLEPADQQEAYDMTREAFELSERFHMPVMLRLVTRLAHSRGIVIPRPRREPNPVSKATAPNQWILLPSNARRQWHERLLGEAGLRYAMEQSPFNTLTLSSNRQKLAVITTGTARNYYLEVAPELPSSAPHLHIGAAPLPAEKIHALLDTADEVLVLEEGYPYVERLLRGIAPAGNSATPAGASGPRITGRLSGKLPQEGELNPDLIRKALGLPLRKNLEAPAASSAPLPGRPPQLCPGCPHIDSFGSLKQSLSEFGVSLVTGDIGCSTLGAMPEYKAIESCVCMGASIGMAKGAAEAGLRPVLAVIGDSTFLHSGITALVDAVATNPPMTVLILDNQTVAMTGGQPTMLPSGRIKEIVLGLGVNPEHVHQIETHRTRHQENSALLRREIDYPGLSVIIAVRECIETAKKHKKSAATPEVSK